MGVSFFNVVKQIFIPLLFIIILTITLTYLGLFFIFITDLNIRTIPIVQILVRVGGLQLFGVVTVLVISSVLLLLIPLYSLLKNNSMNRILMSVNYVMKVTVLVVMLPLVSTRINLMQENLTMINHVRHYQQNSTVLNHQFSPMLQPRYRGDGYDTLLMELLRFGAGAPPDPAIIYEHNLLYEYHRAHQILMDAGAIFVQSSALFMGEPVLIVNENYLFTHPIRDLYGNFVCLSDFTADSVYLVPEIYSNERFIAGMIERGDQIVIIDNEQAVFDYTLFWRWQFGNIPIQPYIIHVFRDDVFRLTASPFNFVFYDGDFNGILYDTIFYNRIVISTMADELQQIRSSQIDDVIEHVLVMLPMLLLVLMIIIQYSYLYLKTYQKRVYTRKLVGHNQFAIFSHLLIESSLAVLAAVSVAWYLRLDFMLLFTVILFDFAVYLVTIAVSKWKHSLTAEYSE